MAKQSPQPASSGEHWEQPANNKREKKRIVSGQATQTPVGKTRKKPTKKAPASRDQSQQARIDSLMECFAEIEDPRINRRRRHLLIDIIVIATCAVICNADTWKDISIWGETHEQWLSTMLELPNGIPTRDTFRRTISRIDPDAFQQAFINWISGLGNQGGVVAIDGKTLRATKVNGNKPLHIVSAWASSQHLTLGQTTIDEKSNEITAIPALLNTLQLKDAIVTIDAMGCQKEIAQKVIDGKGDYCLAAKGNQEKLANDIAAAFETAMSDEDSQDVYQHHHVVDPKRPHGRHEERYYYTMPVPESLRTADQWPGLKSIGLTITYRATDAKQDVNGEVRYYIMSFASDVERFAEAVRGHWGIENSLHWVMDLTFREDESRIRKDYGGENVSWLRRLAITLIKNETSFKDSIRGKRIRAGYDTDYLEKILAAIPAPN
jgi:predicted transposase YbfD/YdcC